MVTREIPVEDAGASPIGWVQLIGGLAITAFANAVLIAVSYGALVQQVDNNTDELEHFKNNMTPSAAARVASIEATDRALQAQIDQLRAELIRSHSEVIEALRDLQSDLKQHMRDGR